MELGLNSPELGPKSVELVPKSVELGSKCVELKLKSEEPGSRTRARNWDQSLRIRDRNS